MIVSCAIAPPTPRLAACVLIGSVVVLGVPACDSGGADGRPQGVEQNPQPEDRGLLPIIGYQRPLLTSTPGEPNLRFKVLYLMPPSASAPLDASRPVTPSGCTVAAEVAGAGTDRVVVNLRLQWTADRVVEGDQCNYDRETAKEAYVLVDDIPPTAAILTDGPLADVHRDQLRAAGLGNPVPEMPEARPPGG